MIPEKLVEEIRKQHCKSCLFLRCLGGGKCGASVDLCRERIKRDITRILKAARDGELDEALGVVGRGTIKYPKTSADLDEHSEIWDGELVIWDGPHQVPSPYRFIALSLFPSLGIPVGRDPLGTGTNKEEE